MGESLGESDEPRVSGPLPGPRARAIVERDAASASPSMIKPYPLVVARGEGCWIEDVDGNRFLDFMAGIAVTSTGHAHPAVVEAIRRAAGEFLHVCATDFYYESATRLQERLAGYVPAMGPKRVFLTNSGTEAVEGAIKLARHHTRRPNLIAFRGAFHGRSLGALSLNASKVVHRAHFGPLLPGVYHVPYSHPSDCPFGRERAACESDCRCVERGLEAELFSRFTSPEEVAAIVVEPILGEGGYVVPAPKFLSDLRALCDRHGILLVFDEIQCGVGRTGRMFAAERFDVAPDVLLAAKGLGSGMPIGAIVARKSVMSWPPGSHGSTFAGNPVCCAAALATLDVVEAALPGVAIAGAALLDGLRELRRRHPRLGEVRGVGLMVGVELVDPDTGAPDPDLAHELERRAFERGLLLLTAGRSALRFAPPLVVTPEQVALGLRLFAACLDDAGAGRSDR